MQRALGGTRIAQRQRRSPHFVLLFQQMFSAASIRLAALVGLVQLSDV